MNSDQQQHHEELIASSTTALRSLTISSETADRSVRDATAALTELLSKVSASRVARDELARAERRYKQRNDKALAELERVDLEIAQAKVGAVELFEERDEIRREITRSKQVLDEVQEFERVEAEREAAGEEKNSNSKASLSKQEKEVSNVEAKVADVMRALSGLEEGLLVTTDELDTLRKRKEKLKGKLTNANADW